MRHTARIVEGVRFGGEGWTKPLLENYLSEPPKQQILEGLVGVLNQTRPVERALEDTLRSDGYAWSMANIKKSSPVKKEITSGWQDVILEYFRDETERTSMTVSVALEMVGVRVARESGRISAAVRGDLT